MKTKSHLKLRALCEGAIMVALAQVLGYLKFFELPQGGSITIGMLPIFLYCARWGFGPGMLASIVYSVLQLLLDGAYAWGWQSMVGDYILAFSVLGLAGLPIFTEGGGLWYVLKPSFGYIIGFVAGTFVTGWIADHMKEKTILRYLFANLAGLMVVYAFGMIYYYIICNYVINTPIGVWPLFLYCFLLAVPGDIALSILGAVIAKRVRPVIGFHALYPAKQLQNYKT